MKRILILSVLFIAVSVFAQERTNKNERQIFNQLWNMTYTNTDSIAVTTTPDTLVMQDLTYNLLLSAIDGDVLFKAVTGDSSWSHWFRLKDGSSISISGVSVDTLYSRTATGTAGLQVLQGIY